MDPSQLLYPREATLFLTDRCNFRCEKCKRQVETLEGFQDMTVETIQRLLEVYPTIKGVCVAGLGEPTLCQQFSDIVNFLGEKDRYVGIITNGTNARKILSLKRPPNYVSVSLYGFDKGSYLDSVKIDIFEVVKSNFRAMRSQLPQVGVSFFVNKRNYKILPKIVQLAEELDASFINVTNYLVYDVSRHSELDQIITVKDKEIIGEIDGYLAVSKRVGARPVYLDVDRFQFFCSSYRTLINVDGAGNIGACQRQFPPSPMYGNIFDQVDHFNTGKILENRQRIQAGQYPHENCASCFGKMNPYKEKIPNIGVFILFHEKVDQTIDCINSFSSFDIPIYVLNNNSSPKSTEELLIHLENSYQVKVIHSNENVGVGVGRNLLIGQTTEEWLFFVDNDITMQTHDFLMILQEQIEAHPDIDAFIPSLFNVHENEFVRFLEIKVEDGKVNFCQIKTALTNFFPGGASVVNRRVFNKHGLYDRKMFIGLEDMEFALRSLLNGSPFKCKLVSDIVLRHDHRVVSRKEDKRAVMTRYNMGIQEGSYRRIQEKYPNINFNHSYQSWVVAQQKKMLHGELIDLASLTPLRNFGAPTLVPELVDIFQQVEADLGQSEIIEKIAARFSGFKNILFLGCSNSREAFAQIFPMAFFADPVWLCAAPNGNDIPLEPDQFDALDKWALKVYEQKIELIIVNIFLEKLQNPMPFLRTLRNLLMGKERSCLLIVDEYDLLSEKTFPTRADYWRQWTKEGITRLLSSAGFLIKDFRRSSSDNKRWFIELSADLEEYDLHLQSLYMPSPNIEYLVVSQEHAAAEQTGGIGTYVAELEKVVSAETLGLLLTGTGVLLPDRFLCKKNRYMFLEHFFGEEFCLMEAEDALAMALDLCVFFFTNLKVIEFQDVNGKGYRFLQAKETGRYPNSLMTQTLCHASRISLEKLFSIWIDPADQELLQEKLVIEKADSVKFPTRYLRDFYQQVGYNLGLKKVRLERLPFLYESNRIRPEYYLPIDTLIFFGKRSHYKGFDLFTDVVKKITAQRRDIQRILLIGPRFQNMEESNAYFDNLSAHGLTVEEYSLQREEAINLIAQNAHRAICILPYVADNHPYSVLEVISTGCLMIATRAGGLPELLPDEFAGRLLSEHNPDALADLVLTWLSTSPSKRQDAANALLESSINDQSLINDSLFSNVKDVHAVWESTPKSTRSSDALVNCLIIADENFERLAQLLKMIQQQTWHPEAVLCLVRQSKNPSVIFHVKEVVASLGDPRFQVLMIEKLTDGEMLNEGLQHLPSGLVSILHPRVSIKNSYFRSLVNYMRCNPECAYVSSYLLLDPAKGSGEKKARVEKYLGEGVITSQSKNTLGHAFGIFNGELLRKCGGFPYQAGISRNGWATLIRVASLGYGIGVVPEEEVLLHNPDEYHYGGRYAEQYQIALETQGLNRFEGFRLQGIIRKMESLCEENISLQIALKEHTVENTNVDKLCRRLKQNRWLRRIANVMAFLYYRWPSLSRRARGIPGRI